MNNYDKNIDLNGLGFPQRLRAFRKSRNMNRRDLANLSGLSEKTIYNIEMGNQKNTLQKTRMLLAQALDLSLDELTGTGGGTITPSPPPPSSHKPPPWIGIGAVVIAVLTLSLGILWHQSCANAEWTIDNGQLVVRDELLGKRLWEMSGNDPIVKNCRISPWNPSHLIVGTHRSSSDDGQLLCLKRASGDTVWAVGPDINAMVRAFGADVVMSAKFSCRQPKIANWDGDANPEIIVPFGHGRYYPFAICVISSDGSLLSQYAHKGHISDLVIVDVDKDGKDEVIAVGTNNNRAYIGATLLMLDNEHCNGASMDSLCNPWSNEPDSSLVRIILPNYPAPYMKLMSGLQLSAFRVRVVKDNEGKTMISVEVRSDNPLDKITVFLDSELRPVRASVDDSFFQYGISQWPDSLKNGVGPGDPDWLADWLAGYKRFEVGQPSP